MRLTRIVFVLGFLALISMVSAQDVVLEKVEVGHRIEVYAKNNGAIDYEITLEVTLVHVEADRELPAVEVVPSGKKVLLTTLTPEVLKPWSYKTKYKFDAYNPAPVEVAPVATTVPEEKPAAADPTTATVESNSSEAGVMNEIASEKEEDDISVWEMNDQTIVDTMDKRPVPEIEEPEQEASTATEAIPAKVVPVKQHEVVQPRGRLSPPVNTDDEPMPGKYYKGEDLTGSVQVLEAPGELSQKEIIVFGQVGCPRCEQAKTYYQENDIDFTYRNITGDKQNSDAMSKFLFDNGFTGGQFVMPVIVVDGEVHYSIEDLTALLERSAESR